MTQKIKSRSQSGFSTIFSLRLAWGKIAEKIHVSQFYLASFCVFSGQTSLPPLSFVISVSKAGVSRGIFLPSLRFLVPAFFILHSTFLFAQGPAWWYQRGAVDANLPTNDYALITQGQLKWMAASACAEMEAYFGAGPTIPALIAAFSSANNYYPANLGQVKYVAQPFYDRLYDLNLTNTLPSGMPGYYPWSNSSSTNDFALANIGQVKYVFSFDSAVDSDGDGASDWQEAELGTDPYDPDSDDDGLSDGWEVRNGFNPLDAGDGVFEPLTGWWKLNEMVDATAYDNSIYTNNGIASGVGVADAGWNFVYAFDGTNSAVLIANSCHYKSPYVSVAAVVCFAACPDAVTNGGMIDGRMPLLAQKNPSAGFAYALYKTTTNALVFEIATLSATNVLQTADNFLTTGVWYHVAGVYDGTNASLYVNGEMVGTTPFSGPLEYDPGSGLTLGKAECVCGSASNQSYLSGLLSDVRVYSSGLASNQVYGLCADWHPYYTNTYPESQPNYSMNGSCSFSISLCDSDCSGVTLVASGSAVQQSNVTWQIVVPKPSGIRLDPDGCRARLKGNGTVKVRGAAGIHTQTVTVVSGQTCGSGKCAWGTSYSTLDSLNIAIGLGRAFDGSAVGTLNLMSSNMNSSLSKPSALSCVAKPEVEQIWTNSMMRQVRATEGLLDIVTNNDYAYEIRFYAAAVVGAKANGLYGVQGDPIKVLEVRNPDEAADSNRLWITETVTGHTNRTEFIYDGDFQTWGLSKGDGLSVETLLTEDLGNGYRLETRHTMDSNEVTVAQSETMFYTFAWGEGVVGRWVECGNAQLVTSNDYYNNAAEPGRYGQLCQEVHSDGSWTSYDYDTNGRVTSVVSPWKSVPAGTSAGQAKAEYRSYASVDQNDTIAVRPWEPRLVRETVLNVEVGRTYFAWYVNGNGETVRIEERCGAPGADYGATGNLRTTTVYYPTNTTDGSAGQVKSVTYPDGRYELSEFELGAWQADSENPTNGNFYVGQGSDAIRRITLHASTANPNGLVNRSLKDVEVLVNGRSVLNETYLLTAQEDVRIAYVVRVLDAFGHVTAEVKSDGRRTDATWACCGKDYEKDEQGLERYYLYDALNRLESTEQAGVTAGEYPAQAAIYWTYAYDAAGRMLREERQAGGLSQITSNTYDLADRLLGKTDSAGLVTACAYSESPKQVQETLPGGATRVTEQFADGRLASVTGTAQTPMYYDYGVNEDGTQWTVEYKGSSGSPCWTKTTTDLLGRTIRVEKPGFNGSETNEYFYNSKGQLIRQSTAGGPQSLFAYDELGNQIQSGLDINANGELDLAGTDRISETDTSYAYYSSDWWKETVNRIYATDNNSTAITNAITRQRLTGFAANTIAETVSVDAYGNQTTASTVLDRSAKKVTQTTTLPDSSSNVVTVMVNGLVQSQTSKSGITTTYGYDSLGRRNSVTDARLGNSVTHYDSHGWVDYVEDAAGNQTTFTYDSATGRKVSQIDAMSNTTYMSYSAFGQLEKTWGSGAYPVSYNYDAYGRMTAMSTYRGGSDWSSASWPANPGTADTTTWMYNEATGLLTNKQDAAGQSVTYTYATGGKLASRTWSRLVGGAQCAATYSYNDAGDLSELNYSDSTPDVSFTYDRLGRQKTAESSVSAHTFAYNGLLLDTETIISSAGTNVIDRSYDGYGRAAGFDLSDTSYAVQYGYDAFGRFNSVSSSVQSVSSVVNYSYLANSDLISSLTSDLGPLTSRSYEDHRNLITQIKNEFGTNVISQFDYLNDAAGRRTRRIDLGIVTNDFGYNTRSELISAVMGANVFGYAYDPIGNRLTSAWYPVTTNEEPGTTNWYSANSLNQYTQLQVMDNGSQIPNGASTSGGTIATTGGHRIHTFTSNGTFEVSGGSLTCDVLVVAGGGGGSSWPLGAGGGAGGLVYTNLNVTGTNLIAVGAGGVGGCGVYSLGGNGSNSVFGSITAYGGGHGACYGHAAGSGGSGGGGAWFAAPGDAANGQGNAGGVGVQSYQESDRGQGGGGGAGAVGGEGVIGQAGAGGVGLEYDISGTETYYAGGGGGSGEAPAVDGQGGLGGGGKGSNDGGDNGLPFSGGGGGGSERDGTTQAGAGGSGIVIVRYPLSPGIITNTPTYDADGNLTNDGNFAYAWNGENRLVAAEPLVPSNGTRRVEYAYDYQGRRAWKKAYAWNGSDWNTTADEVRKNIYDDFNLIAEIIETPSATNIQYYVWSLDLSGTLQGAGGVGGLLSMTRQTASSTNTFFYMSDANGNISDLVNASGTSVASYQYSPYGQIISSTGVEATNNTMTFSTKPWDADIRKYGYIYRDYEPDSGRWTSQDPLGEAAFALLNKAMISAIRMNKLESLNKGWNLANLLQAFHNDPVSRIDVNGMIDHGNWHSKIIQYGGLDEQDAVDVWYSWGSGVKDACPICTKAKVRRSAGWIHWPDGSGAETLLVNNYGAIISADVHAPFDQPGDTRGGNHPYPWSYDLNFNYYLHCTEGLFKGKDIFSDHRTFHIDGRAITESQ